MPMMLRELVCRLAVWVLIVDGIWWRVAQRRRLTVRLWIKAWLVK